MNKTIQDLHEKANAFKEKYNDDELYEYLLSLAHELERAEGLKHQFGYFVMHAKAVVPYQAAPKHFREALDRANRFLKAEEENG